MTTDFLQTCIRVYFGEEWFGVVDGSISLNELLPIGVTVENMFRSFLPYRLILGSSVMGLHIESKMYLDVRGSFFMFVESGCISTNIEFTVP